jgi:hypothetical protein
MTFLNPFVLFGLAAAAIPVLLHLLNLRKLRTVEFSSVRFLKELQKTSMRRLRIRQILLLILRTLLIVAVVMAFSRPALRIQLGGFGAPGASSTMIIILDDSPSMNFHDERGTAFTRASQAASRLIELAREGDRLFLVPLSELRAGNPLPAPRTPESAREALSRLTPSQVSVLLSDALATIRPLLASSPDANREVMFVSDGQATQLVSTPSREPPPDSGGGLDPRVTLFLCSSPPLRHENTGVTGGEILTRIVSDKKPVRFRPRINNWGDEPVRGSVVSLYSDGARVAQQSLDISPRGEIRPVFSFMVKRRGILGCSIQIEDDAFESDNVYAFVVEVPEHIAVLLSGPDAPSTRLATLALTLGGDSLLAGHLSAVQTTNAELPSVDLSHFDVIVVCGFEGLTAEVSRSVARFVSEGGGLILFPHATPASHDGALFRALGLPSPSGQPVTAPAGSFFSFSTVDYAHPLFEGLFDTRKGSGRGEPAVESPRVLTALPLSAGEKGTRVIGLTNGNAFLVDQSAGTGRVLIFAVEAGTGWSDFPLKGLFAPLLHRSIAYTGSRPTPRPSLVPGDRLEFSLRLRTFTDRDTYTITSPGGNTQKVVPEFQPAAGTAVFNGGIAREPGVYRLSRDGRGAGAPAKDFAALAVNISPGESDLRTATNDDIEKFRLVARIPPGQIHTMPPEQAAETVRQTRYGFELWKDFVVLAALLAIAEMAVGRVAGAKTGIGEGA